MTDEDKARWRRLVGDWESSDLTQREYAQERGITVYALRYWIYRLRRESRPLEASESEPLQSPEQPASPKKDLRLVPVRAVACAPKARTNEPAGELLELVMPSGIRLRFPVGTAPTYLQAVTAVLEP